MLSGAMPRLRQDRMGGLRPTRQRSHEFRTDFPAVHMPERGHTCEPMTLSSNVFKEDRP